MLVLPRSGELKVDHGTPIEDLMEHIRIGQRTPFLIDRKPAELIVSGFVPNLNEYVCGVSLQVYVDKHYKEQLLHFNMDFEGSTFFPRPLHDGPLTKVFVSFNIYSLEGTVKFLG